MNRLIIFYSSGPIYILVVKSADQLSCSSMIVCVCGQVCQCSTVSTWS